MQSPDSEDSSGRSPSTLCVDMITAAAGRTHKASCMKAYAQSCHAIQIPSVANQTRGTGNSCCQHQCLQLGSCWAGSSQVWAGRIYHAWGVMSGGQRWGSRVQARTVDVKRGVPGLLPSLDGRSGGGVQQGLQAQHGFILIHPFTLAHT